MWRGRSARAEAELVGSKLTNVDSTHERRRPTRFWLVASLVLVAVGVIFLVAGMHGPKVGPSIPGPIGKTSPSGLRAPAAAQLNFSASAATAPSPTFATLSDFNPSPLYSSSVSTSREVSLVSSAAPPARRPSAPPRLGARSIARSVPVHLSIPAIGLSDSLSELGLNKDGTVQVPTSWAVPGWYRLGPSPGQVGSAVILGHVDSVHGPAAFYRLASLRPGNKVSVTLADGRTVRFEVIGLRMYLKSKFPDHLVYGPRSYSALQLVTCGGIFDSGSHHYLSNLVVFTDLVK
jgi:hypothetical protein